MFGAPAFVVTAPGVDGALFWGQDRLTSNAGIVQALDVGAAVSPTGVWVPYLTLD